MLLGSQSLVVALQLQLLRLIAGVLEAAAFTKPRPDDTAGSFPLRVWNLKSPPHAGEYPQAECP